MMQQQNEVIDTWFQRMPAGASFKLGRLLDSFAFIIAFNSSVASELV